MQWIPVTEALPPIEAYVLATQPWWTASEIVWAWGDRTSFGDSMFLAYYDHGTAAWSEAESDQPILGNDVRFWMPLPAPPDGCAWNVRQRVFFVAEGRWPHQRYEGAAHISHGGEDPCPRWRVPK